VTTPDERGIVDRARTAGLTDVGSPMYEAATVISRDGTPHLALVRKSDVGNLSAVYDESASAVEHEQLGPLPPQTIRRISG
jgi:hypothetical protein